MIYISSSTKHLNQLLNQDEKSHIFLVSWSTQQKEIMFKPGLISFALRAALFFAVFNCATISKETQAELRDVQARDNDIEQREGM